MASTVSQQIVDPYAEALLAIAQEQNLIGAFADDARLLVAVLEASPELVDFLANPVVKGEAKASLLERTFAEQIHPIWLTTLKVLTQRRRLMFVAGVCRRYLELQRKLQKIALAEVTSAVELSQEQQQAIAERVRHLSQVEQVEVQTQLDSDLIGGVVIKIGSQVIDLSLRGQLRRMALQLA